ncbi:hypothetical protein BS47DRAFT_719667 [Hydnum rufescens UP504]|uniref:Tyrosinase copper-binding domain-containing protein n=1 Tax=Hydnum rufescens UP504 TaxID=1448309 RepID=A0A9P6AEB2_9AGAM|nr:hypothetical protein BS47DRAFT_719667 [Hydnum rufescens UP504]
MGHVIREFTSNTAGIRQVTMLCQHALSMDPNRGSHLWDPRLDNCFPRKTLLSQCPDSKRMATAHRQPKANWLSAVKCLSHKPRSRTFAPSHSPPDIVAYNTSGSLYDDFVFLHMEQNHWIHSTGFFLPWHRWFVYQFTKALQEQCGYEE